ncbi:MAG TPA: sulfatase [Rhizomicrobium sp.]|jgi:arylsulfatase A-like enzyme
MTVGAKNAIVLLLDSLNRHMVGAYGGREFATPNLDRLAARSLRFTRHYAASLPCMPARHDILCGAWDFLWRPWGSVEIWEDAITYPLRRAGVVSQLISDHPHLFESGGENYHVDFTAWDYQRGHEGDAWKTKTDPSWAGSHHFGFARDMPYDKSRGYFRGEEDFPGPRTMRAAARWLEDNAGAHDRFFLFVDEFDPHEPFDTPEKYIRETDPTWDGPMNLIWPPYAVNGVARGVLSQREGRHIRARYGAKLMMIDRWLGKVLDTIDAKKLWDDTLVILCTDHGHYLGEKDIWGKPGVPLYETMSHIPLLIAAPGVAPGTNDALTTSVDIHATLSALFGVETRQRTHGRSLLPLIDGSQTRVRDWLLAGVWGREVHYIDEKIKYARAPSGKNAPHSMWSNRWSTMPTHILPREQELPLPDDRARLDKMPGANVPVIRQSWDESDPLPFWAAARFSGNHLYDLPADPNEVENLAGSSREATAADALREALRAVEAPEEQFLRLGLT